MHKLAIILLFVMFSYACDEKPEPPPINFSLPLPGPMYLGFSDSNALHSRFGDYMDSFNSKSSFELDMASYYLDSNNDKVYSRTTYLLKEKSQDSFYYPYYVLAINETPYGHFAKESLEGILWYIDWPGGRQDTLFADYREDPDGPNSCMCLYPLESLLLNGKSMIANTKFYDNGVYVFEP